MNCTPLRIVEYDEAQPDRLFGMRPDVKDIIPTRCQTIFVIELNEASVLFLGLKDDFGFVLDHRDEVLYSDGANVVIQALPRNILFSHEPELHPVVSLLRLESVSDDDPIELAEIHKLGGTSYWLSENPNPNLQFVAQLAFPDGDDYAVDLDWPTGAYTIEVFWDKDKNEYCVLWRMHA